MMSKSILPKSTLRRLFSNFRPSERHELMARVNERMEQEQQLSPEERRKLPKYRYLAEHPRTERWQVVIVIHRSETLENVEPLLTLAFRKTEEVPYD